MALWAVFGAMVKRQLQRARRFEGEQERRLLDAYVRGRSKRKQSRENRP